MTAFREELYHGYDAVDEQAIVLSIDLEMYELDGDRITEIGIAAHDLGDGSIQNIHLVTQSELGNRNGRYVADHRFNFNYGRSLVLRFTSLRATFNWVVGYFEDFAQQEGVPLYIIGHGMDKDIELLEDNGFYLPDNATYVDTRLMWRASTNKFSSLEKILVFLRIPHRHLHNAGNDANYTMEIFLRMVDRDYRRAHRLDSLQITEDNMPIVYEHTPQAREMLSYGNEDNHIHLFNAKQAKAYLRDEIGWF